MKDFFNLNNLKMGLGFATGFIIYDYFVNGEIHWIAAIVAAILTVAIMLIFKKSKK